MSADIEIMDDGRRGVQTALSKRVKNEMLTVQMVEGAPGLKKKLGPAICKAIDCRMLY